MNILNTIGNTPLVKVYDENELWVKLEGTNPFGSVKDRAAEYVICKGIRDGVINKDTEVIESSSGNFAIALAGVCKVLGIKFTCVIDPLISKVNRRILDVYGANIIESHIPDKNGNYVKDRIRIVKNNIQSRDNMFWPNQYDNPVICEAYEKTIGSEISTLEKLDYLFVAVSTCGTISGISRAVKKEHPETQIIAVDVEGSHIFQSTDSKKYINGMGASFTPPNLQRAHIDDYIIVDTRECIEGCEELLRKGILAGASSGAVLSAFSKAKKDKKLKEKSVSVGVLPDRGSRYLDTIYDSKWQKEILALTSECE